jgi:hypothetical protein
MMLFGPGVNAAAKAKTVNGISRELKVCIARVVRRNGPAGMPRPVPEGWYRAEYLNAFAPPGNSRCYRDPGIAPI